MALIPAGRLQVATPATMAASVRGGTEATDAVDERIESVAADLILANADEIAQAAADLAQSDAGLWKNQGALPAATDLNTVITQGLYTSPANAVNAPTATVATFEVIPLGGGVMLQRWTPHSSPTLTMQRRRSAGGVWTVWTPIWQGPAISGGTLAAVAVPGSYRVSAAISDAPAAVSGVYEVLPAGGASGLVARFTTADVEQRTFTRRSADGGATWGAWVQVLSGVMSQSTEYSEVGVDSAMFIAEPTAIDRNGKTPAWVLGNHRDRMGRALLGLVGFGDSMFAAFGGITSVMSLLNALVPVTASHRAMSGWSATEIAIRQGGLNLLVNIAGGTIPASGPVAATVDTAGSWMAGSRAFTGDLCGVRGQLVKDAENAWTFTRASAGDAVAAPGGSLWVSADRTGAMVGQLLRGGRNGPDLDLCKRDMLAMLTRARTLGPVLVLPVYKHGTETPGTPGHTLITSINAAYAEIAGSDFIDSEAWLIKHGLTEMGLTPTAQDNTDIANGVIPASLRMDNIHLNLAGRTAEARFLARITTAKDWYRS